MAAYTAERAAEEVVEDHVEDVDGRGHHEVYAVLAARATFTLDRQRWGQLAALIQEMMD